MGAPQLSVHSSRVSTSVAADQYILRRKETHTYTGLGSRTQGFVGHLGASSTVNTKSENCRKKWITKPVATGFSSDFQFSLPHPNLYTSTVRERLRCFWIKIKRRHFTFFGGGGRGLSRRQFPAWSMSGRSLGCGKESGLVSKHWAFAARSQETVSILPDGDALLCLRRRPSSL